MKVYCEIIDEYIEIPETNEIEDYNEIEKFDYKSEISKYENLLNDIW